MTTTDDGLNGVVKHGTPVTPLPPEDLIHERDSNGPQDAAPDVVDLRDAKPAEPLQGRVIGPEISGPVVAPWERDYSHRQSVLPPWLRSRDDLKHALRHWRGEVGYWLGVILFRLFPRLLMYSPRGLWRAVSSITTWWWYLETRQARLDALAAGQNPEWHRMEGLRRQETRKRTIIIAVLIVVWLIFTLAVNIWLFIHGGFGLVVMVAKLMIPVVGLSATVGCGFLGRPRNKPMLTLPMKPQGPFVLRPELIQKAFVAAKLASEKNPIVPITDPHRDGPGWRARIKLPEGVSATKAIEKRVEIAAGFDNVLADQMFLRSDKGQASGSERAIEIWIADVVPSTLPAGVTPLLDVARLDFWKPFPIGVDERGNPVLLTLVWLSVIIAGLPRMGKTFVARMFCLAAALDPHIEIRIFDFRPSADWKPLRLVAHELHSGVTRDPDTGLNPVQQLNRVCDELLMEIERRGHVLRSLPYSMCPEGKITPEITQSPTLRMPFMLTVVDEFHVPIQDDTYGEDIGKKLADIVKRGPAVGAITVTATQKPGGLKGEAGRLYAQIRDSSAARMILRCPNKQVSYLATGDPDLDASSLPQTAKGAILINGAEAEIEVRDGLVRTYLADSTHANIICKRGRAVREEAGTLAGMALGVNPEQEPIEARNLIADLLTVMAGEEQMHSDKLASRLATEWPSSYPGWASGTVGVRAITLGLKPWNVVPGDTWDAEPLVSGTSPNKTGVKRDDLLRALAGEAAAAEARAVLAAPVLPSGTVGVSVSSDAGTGGVDDPVDDELVIEAATLAVKIGYASAPMLHRKLRIGHAKAVAVLDRLESAGVVASEGPGDSREVIIGPEDLAGAILLIRDSG